MTATLSISSIIGFILGLICSYLLYKFVLSKRNFKEVQSNILEHKQTEEFQSLLEVEFRKGIEEGEKRTLGKFALTYEPFIEVSDSFFKKTAEAGYTMQMFYSGLPIGDPMKRITKYEEKYKDENVKYLIDSVNGTLNNILLMVDPLGIPVKVNGNPKIEKKKTG
ncbi:hypothetical protein [Gottfriedia solisilvae]|uniref:Uncharacterized protein n=1 Tax=Gottfriedia solisilvae TaxID=1516104 RepID=A0A8J3AS79_9BACI|nr:hypothetical protein [Gottfriedia solisilvae]GGI17859.1 hypothetical protein GCM10007380_40040 [Gottfriedia solisilvae]